MQTKSRFLTVTAGLGYLFLYAPIFSLIIYISW